jgi:hypothetical protein
MTTQHLSRDELVARLAEISHRTWMRQKERDQGVPSRELDPAVTPHDRERSEDIVQELERLGIWPHGEAATPGQPG